MGILPILLGASIAVAAPAAPAPIVHAPPAEHPALWVVNDNDTIIYLFGTFHALDGKSDWFEQAVKTAFSASDQLMLETLVPKPNFGPVSGRGNLTPAPVVGPTTVAQLAPSASYLASTKVVMSAGRAKGLSTNQGADAVLRDAAEESGKPVGGLESFAFQLSMFNSLQSPPSGSSLPPAQSPQAMQALGKVLGQLEAAWSRGDLETFAPLLRQMQTQTPQSYKTMFVDRNARWAQWIVNRLKTPGTVFVAVGAGHLSGPDSLQNQLAMRGVKSARIN